jgi:hypothetical protein
MNQSPAIPEGYVGNLTVEQEAILKEFWDKFLSLDDKAAAAIVGSASKDKSKKYGRSELHNSFWGVATRESPDAVMLRFLRARVWDIERSFAMMTSALVWRISFGVEEITASGEPVLNETVTGFVSQMKSGKAYLHGVDKENRPVFYIHVQLHNQWAQPASTIEKFTVYSLETGRLFSQPPSDKCCLVFDMTGFGVKNMDMGFIIFLIRTFEAYYPETLGRVLVHNAPWVFWGIWKMISPLLNPVVHKKIAFTKNKKELMEFIDAGRLPKNIGGTEEWIWKYTDPTPAATVKFNDTTGKQEHLDAVNVIRTKFDAKTKEWVKSDSEVIQRDRDILEAELRIASIEVDAYVRPLSVYHEHGNVKEDSTVHWEYKSDAGTQDFGISLDQLKADLAKAKQF